MISVTPNEKNGHVQMPTMPGYYFFHDASTIAISSRSGGLWEDGKK